MPSLVAHVPSGSNTWKWCTKSFDENKERYKSEISLSVLHFSRSTGQGCKHCSFEFDTCSIPLAVASCQGTFGFRGKSMLSIFAGVQTSWHKYGELPLVKQRPTVWIQYTLHPGLQGTDRQMLCLYNHKHGECSRDPWTMERLCSEESRDNPPKWYHAQDISH